MTTSLAVFESEDARGHLNLWVTDGTPAGTMELNPTGADVNGLLSGIPRFSGIATPDFTALGSKALFEGVDANFFPNLWVTDGTLAGTSELAVAGAISGGLLSGSSPDFTVFGNKAVFAGEDASNRVDLWITDGTSGGTNALIPAGADPTGLLAQPAGGPDFTVLGNKVLFAGRDTNFHLDLWVTDGTSAGTSALTVAGASSIGLLSIGVGGPDFTVLGSKAVFVGSGAAPGSDLWVTDGTSAGTTELTVSRLVGSQSDFTVLGNKAVFEGIDTSSATGLWITDGTSAGTSELTVAGSSFLGPFQGINPDFTTLGGKVLFASLNAGTAPNLGVTDGTPAGTSELTVAGANSGGLFGANLPPDFTVLGSIALFEGYDTFGNLGLWVTDGTSAGTRELAPAMALSLGGPPDFTVLGTKALFVGNGNLWVTDGTSAGTSELSTATSFSPLNPSDITVIGAPAPYDFNGDRDSDILWQNDNGQPAVWLMNGTTPSSQPAVDSNPGLSWQVIGAGDFNGDGDADILWQNTNGQAAIWLMKGTTPFNETVVGNNPGPSWQVIGAGDFNGDGDADILWQNTNGQAAIWLMNGTTPFSEVTVGANPGSSWHIVGTGDFNGDGDADILWQNTNGQAAIWLMNGTTPLSETVIGNPGPSWHIVGTGDFNGDGDADILWQNTNGQAAIWLMNGATPFSEQLVGTNPGPSWQIIGAGDYNGDGKSDILWQNTNGQASIWLMNGTTPTFEGLVGSNPGPSWHIHAAS